MQSASVIRIEKNVDRMASTLFALACGYAANLWFAGELQRPLHAAATLAASAFAYLLSIQALGAVRPEPPRLPVPIFDVREVEPMDSRELPPTSRAGLWGPSELLLTDRIQPAPAAGEEPLLLDDILAEPGSNSRVVRLFDHSAMPATKEIDRHFESHASAAQTHDAAQALHEALAELRRSLR